MKFETTKITTFKLASIPNRKITIYEYFDSKVIYFYTTSPLFCIHSDKTMTCVGVRNDGS